MTVDASVFSAWRRICNIVLLLIGNKPNLFAPVNTIIMRRLPVYLVLDTSGSMTGEPIEAVKNGVQVMISSLRQNPQAIETAYISIITFDSDARQAVPLTDLASFQMVDLKASMRSAIAGNCNACEIKMKEAKPLGRPSTV